MTPPIGSFMPPPPIPSKVSPVNPANPSQDKNEQNIAAILRNPSKVALLRVINFFFIFL